MSIDYYDRQGKPLGMMEWARLHADIEYRRVASTHVPEDESGLWVSTVWLGLDHNFMPGGPIAIFETMVFRAGHETNMVEQYSERYATEAAALAGHDRAVMWTREQHAKEVR